MGGLKYQRAFRINEDYLSCANCARNYTMGLPTFCQTLSISIDLNKIIENKIRARKCAYWLPRGVDRSQISNIKDSPDTWYEKDSMG